MADLDTTIEDYKKWMEEMLHYKTHTPLIFSEDHSEVKQKCESIANTLANRRTRDMVTLKSITDGIMAGDINYTLAIGISPADHILDKYTAQEVTGKIEQLFERIRVKKDGHFIRITPLSVVAIGEYSPMNYRWHYHGLIYVKDVDTLDKIRRVLKQKIGRTVIEKIHNLPKYIEYMCKSYIQGNTFTAFEYNKCYLEYHDVETIKRMRI